MFTSEFLFAAALLLAPLESPIPRLSAEEWPVVREELCKLALDMQLLDKRETEFLLVNAAELKNDLTILRRRNTDLKNSPKIEQMGRFPTRDEVNAMLNFNRNYRTQMDNRRITEPHKADEYTQAIQEADKLYLLGDAVRDVRCDFYYVSVRRQALKKLKDLVGDESFYTGQLPPCVPVWRFHEVK